MTRSGILRLSCLLLVITSVLAQVKILQSNDDGWAVANIRAQNTALVAAGFNVVLSAPAENESGTGSSDAEPEPLGSSGCEFSSCPPNSPATGSDPNNPRLNYVNSFPVTSVRFGIQTAAPPFFGGTGPDLVVSGPNVGNNLGTVVLGSGTVGAACEAAKEGFPSVALSGAGGSQVSFETLSTPSASTTTANVFASLGVKVVQALLADCSTPILPRGITLNINYPAATGSCTDPDAFNFVLTRINSASAGTPADVTTCGSDRLPTENSVVQQSGCFVSVSVMNATTKGDVDASTQAVVLNRLEAFLSCA
ncbi:acid phosphatase [Fomitiporia mediterranea MF3/22]|uniref:acid phosphatase n=1 Tax=Fomitiporia mediterranea (strain MF3/22) TaxID=694068 RepID=UPI00044090A0|nr:acid phosphatase [Fomitiporia mediterranea MF3/22]EJD00403.1 acid phosphatase [Fomitiporia mediterranea MF3/22]